MTDVKVLPTKKGRKLGSGWFGSKEGDIWVSAYDYALQSEIQETRERTQARTCFKGCQTCGHCLNSRRNCAHPYNFDDGKKVFCEGCEHFGFHDCNNGFLRNSRGEAEPFTDEAQKLFDSGGKPLQ